MSSEIHLTPQQMMDDIRVRPTVPIWPTLAGHMGLRAGAGPTLPPDVGTLRQSTWAVAGSPPSPRPFARNFASKGVRDDQASTKTEMRRLPRTRHL